MPRYKSLFEDNWMESYSKTAQELGDKFEKFLKEEIFPEINRLNLSFNDLELLITHSIQLPIAEAKVRRMIIERRSQPEEISEDSLLYIEDEEEGTP